MIGIVDYSAGNLQSVKNALSYLNFEYRILTKPEDFSHISKLIVPGVGHFGSAVHNLQTSGLWTKIEQWIKEDRPFLGICLGMQLLFEKSEEAPTVNGFSLIQGTLKKFVKGKVPNIGWNQVSWQQDFPEDRNISRQNYFYFVHSYYAPLTDISSVLGISNYYIPYVSAIKKGNVYGFQFHPERSGIEGLKLLKFWGDL